MQYFIPLTCPATEEAWLSKAAPELGGQFLLPRSAQFAFDESVCFCFCCFAVRSSFHHISSFQFVLFRFVFVFLFCSFSFVFVSVSNALECAVMHY